MDQRKKRELIGTAHALEKLLKSGECVGLFPEGKTSNGEKIAPFKASLFQSALAAKSTVVPVTICYWAQGKRTPADMQMAKGGWLQTLKHIFEQKDLVISVYISNPLSAADFPDRKALSDHVHQEITRIYFSHFQ